MGVYFLYTKKNQKNVEKFPKLTNFIKWLNALIEPEKSNF